MFGGTSYTDALRAAFGSPAKLPETIADAEVLIEAIATTWPAGLHSWLYRVLHDGIGIRRAACDAPIREYKKTLRQG
jgi:hypothetical protein